MNRDEFELKVLEVWRKSRIPLTEVNLQHFAGESCAELFEWLDDFLDRGVLDIRLDANEALTYVVPGTARSPSGPTNYEAYDRKRAAIQEAKRRILARRGLTQENESIAIAKPRPRDGSMTKASATDSASEAESRLQRSRKRAQDHNKVAEEDESEEDESDEASAARAVVGMVGKAALIASTTALVTLDKPLAMLDKPRAKGDKSLATSAALSLLGPVGWLYAGSFREAVPATLAQVAILTVVPTFLLTPFILLGALASSAVGLGYAWRFNRKKGRTPLFLSSGKKSKKSDKLTKKNAE